MNKPLPGFLLAQGKFEDPCVTLKGEVRASVPLRGLDTLWFNTGTLCNITCAGCYIESSPQNDRLAYLDAAEVRSILDEIARDALPTAEIGFTGGEPFMNPDMAAILELCLSRGFKVLVLTNAMQPMQRPAVRAALHSLIALHGGKLSLRISLDHHAPEFHDQLRGAGSFDRAAEGVDWLASQGATLAIAGRTCWEEDEAALRRGFASLFAARGWKIDAADAASLILFPEMDERLDVPEITTSCWSILNVDPANLMCASSRMVVKHKGEEGLSVMPCTLLPYDRRFDMGATLKAAAQADGGMFDRGAVRLNHPHCVRFCVLGGGSCTAS